MGGATKRMMHSKDSCSCYKSGLCVDSRHLSWMVAVIMVLFFLFFVSGYFVGKRKVLEDMHKSVVQESFADKIYASLCTMQSNNSFYVARQESIQDRVEEDFSCVQNHEELAEDMPEENKIEQQIDVAQTVSEETVNKLYYAQLVGFGTHEAALQFCNRLAEQFPVAVKERCSRTAKGKKVTWYQVVTEQFQDRQKLEALVKKVQLKERLRDVRIVTC